MQRSPIILAYLFFSVNIFAQQYPFVHYTPKDGLISNQVRNIYQDSRGRLFFSTHNGLSVYDGARFINYTTQNGLADDIVNCVMEMGEDSVWVVTNMTKINCLVNGKIKTVALKDPVTPIINSLSRDDNGTLYAATDQGLHYFEDGHFIKVPFTDIKGKNISSFITHLYQAGDYMLFQRDAPLINDQKYALYLYNKTTKKITDEKEKIFSVSISPDGNTWISTETNIMLADTNELKKGKLVLRELPERFNNIKNLGRYFIFFDRQGNCWLGDHYSTLIKASPDGSTINFTTASGLTQPHINHIFGDREGITWIATNNAGVDKLVQSNFSFSENPFGFSSLLDISFNEHENRFLLYSHKNSNAAFIREDEKSRYYQIKNLDNISDDILYLKETSNGVFGIGSRTVYKMQMKGSGFYPQPIFHESDSSVISRFPIDHNGSLIFSETNHLVAIVKGNIVFKKKINFFADNVASDNKENIWVANRAGELIMYETNPDDPSNYLEQKKIFSKELTGLSPRSLIIDKQNNIWIGTRYHGIHVFRIENDQLTKKFQLDALSGLSDNFTSHLACDEFNSIWASSASGLDKITVKNGVAIIENITKQNNIYQSVSRVIIDEHNTVWGLVSNGLIRVTSENKKPVDYSPTLALNMIKSRQDTINSTAGLTLSYKQNNLTFYFSSTSFLDEKQILYSYRLRGSSNSQWSEPSDNAFVSFIDLSPGDYTLDIKASFPAGRYPDQTISHQFSIAPPWWQTWWFRTSAGIIIIGILIFVTRLYYNRKLEKQKAALERKQVIEKERTRIATDMHDDLGAGLSRIKFLSETIGIKKQQLQPIEEDISKIREYSHQMIDKMGEIVWALNEKNDSLSDLLSYTRSYAVEYLSQNGVICKVDIPENIHPVFVSGEFRRNIYLTVKEALHNIIKHAQARHVKIKFRVNHQLSITILDDGIGFDKNNIRSFSNGISNMKKRMNDIGGSIQIINKNGTMIELAAPLT